MLTGILLAFSGGVHVRSLARCRAQSRQSTAGSDLATLASVPLSRSPLDVQVPHVQRVLLDELAPRLDLVAHQRREDLVGLVGVLDLAPAAACASPGSSSSPRAARGSSRRDPCSAGCRGPCAPAPMMSRHGRRAASASALSSRPSTTVNGGSPAARRSRRQAPQLVELRASAQNCAVDHASPGCCRSCACAHDDLTARRAPASSAMLERAAARARAPSARGGRATSRDDAVQRRRGRTAPRGSCARRAPAPRRRARFLRWRSTTSRMRSKRSTFLTHDLAAAIAGEPVAAARRAQRDVLGAELDAGSPRAPRSSFR